jgi:hypothetical protein
MKMINTKTIIRGRIKMHRLNKMIWLFVLVIFAVALTSIMPETATGESSVAGIRKAKFKDPNPAKLGYILADLIGENQPFFPKVCEVNIDPCPEYNLKDMFPVSEMWICKKSNLDNEEDPATYVKNPDTGDECRMIVDQTLGAAYNTWVNWGWGWIWINP